MTLWQRFLADFWPLDASRVAPNLVASVIAFTAGWMLKGRQVVQGLHDKLDAHHREQMDAHHATHDAVSNPRP